MTRVAGGGPTVRGRPAGVRGPGLDVGGVPGPRARLVRPRAGSSARRRERPTAAAALERPGCRLRPARQLGGYAWRQKGCLQCGWETCTHHGVS